MINLAQSVLEKLVEHKKRLVTAESCTGGLIAATLTDIPGSSSGLERGFVTYSNQSKADLLGVKGQTLETHGAVSAQTAEEMAAGALANSAADIAISVTGIAGPTGGTDAKPVGTVYFGIATRERCTSVHKMFEGTRASIREKSLNEAFQIILNELG